MAVDLSIDRTTAAGQRRGLAALGRIPSGVILIIGCAYFLLPLWWLLVSSTKNQTTLFGAASSLWFSGPVYIWNNFTQLVTYNDGVYVRWFGNSLLYAVSGAVGATLIATMAGYSLSKFRFRGRMAVISIVLVAVMVPSSVLVVPLFILFSSAGITNTIWAVILPNLLSPFGVYLMLVYISDSVPDNLISAARIDGAGEFRIFRSIALPILKPALVTVFLLSLVAIWNDYFLPLAMLSNVKLLPITVGIGLWAGQASSSNAGSGQLWSMIITACMVSIIPLVISFLTLQRYWQNGLTIGSLK